MGNVSVKKMAIAIEVVNFETSNKPRRRRENRPVMVEMEFLLPDEERDFQLARLDPCPKCFNRMACMHKRLDWNNGKKPMYSIRCMNSKCGHETENVESTQMAIQTWKVIAALNK